MHCSYRRRVEYDLLDDPPTHITDADLTSLIQISHHLYRTLEEKHHMLESHFCLVVYDHEG